MIDSFIDNDGIFRVVFTGKITLQSITEWLVKFSQTPSLPSKLNLLYDLREADLEINSKDIFEIAKKTEVATQKYEKINSAFVVEQSKATAYVRLFTFTEASAKAIRKVFITSDAAVKWLLSN